MIYKYGIETGKHYNDERKRLEKTTVVCGCGQNKLLINWLTAPYTGGYLKVTCPDCNESKVIFDDYS